MHPLIRILEEKDVSARGHAEKVAEYSEKVALKMGLSHEKAALTRLAALFHDIGKLGVQENILYKKGELTEEEWSKIKEHPIIGEDMLKAHVLDEEMRAIVRSHHERYDGVGYPDKIDGRNISLLAQIISVADAYDAMTTTRVYREALTRGEAIRELKNGAGTQFNPWVVEAFLAILEEMEACEKSLQN